MVCHSVYLSLLSFNSVLWFSVHKSFTSKGGFCTTLFELSESGMGKMGSWREGMSSLPSVRTLWLLVVQVCRAMPFTSAYKWAPYWEFSLNLSVHLTIEMSTSTLQMPGLCPKDPGIPTYEWAYQTIKSSAIKKNQKTVQCLFLIFGIFRVECSSVVATAQISLFITNILQTIINVLS